MSFDDVRLRNFSRQNGPFDVGSALRELEAEISNGARFPFGPLGEFTLALRTYAKEAMTAKDRALFRLMMTVTSGCEHCIADALVGAIGRGATRLEIKSALTRGVVMAERPAMIFAGEALAYFDAIKAHEVTREDGSRKEDLLEYHSVCRIPEAAA